MRFLDTNIFLRYLAPEDPVKAVACLRLMEALESGDEQAFTSESVISEVAYVLRSKSQYGIATPDVISRLRTIIGFRGLQLANKSSFQDALDIWDAHPRLDFEDAMTIAHMNRLGINDLLSYDRDFDKVPGIRRIEP